MKKKTPKVMGRTDVAEFLGVSRQYVDKIVSESKIPCQETSAGTVFLENDVLTYKKARMKKAKIDTRIRLKKSK